MSLAKHKIIRFWGLTAQRGWARLSLDRRLGLVVSPAELPHATARDPDQDASDHFIFFNSTNGQMGGTVLQILLASARGIVTPEPECQLPDIQGLPVMLVN